MNHEESLAQSLPLKLWGMLLKYFHRHLIRWYSIEKRKEKKKQYNKKPCYFSDGNPRPLWEYRLSQIHYRPPGGDYQQSSLSSLALQMVTSPSLLPHTPYGKLVRKAKRWINWNVWTLCILIILLAKCNPLEVSIQLYSASSTHNSCISG